MDANPELFKLISRMDTGRMLKVVDQLHETTGRSRIRLLGDIIYCGLRYQAGYNDYAYVQMYDMDAAQRATIVTRGINNAIVRRYNDPTMVRWLDDKSLFYQKFDDLLDRPWMKVTSDGTDRFAALFSGCRQIVVKPLEGTHGQGVARMALDGDVQTFYHQLAAQGPMLAEGVLRQDPLIAALHPGSINTVRLVTFKGRTLVAYLRIGTGANVVDNFNHGGIMCPIDETTGRVEFPALRKDGALFTRHPDTDQPIVGLQIPRWEMVRQLGAQAAARLPEVGYIGWDVCVGPHRPCLVEGNNYPGHDIYQLPPHRRGKEGLLPKFRAAGIEV